MHISLTPLNELVTPTPSRSLGRINVTIARTWRTAGMHKPAKARAAAMDAVDPNGYRTLLAMLDSALRTAKGAPAFSPTFNKLFEAYEHPLFSAWKLWCRRYWVKTPRGYYLKPALPFKAYMGTVTNADGKGLARFKCDGLSLKVDITRMTLGKPFADEEIARAIVSYTKSHVFGFNDEQHPGRDTMMPDTLGHHLQRLAVYTWRRKKAEQLLRPVWGRNMHRVGGFDNGFEHVYVSIPGTAESRLRSAAEQEATRIACMDLLTMAGADARCIGWLSKEEFDDLLTPYMLAKF